MKLLHCYIQRQGRTCNTGSTRRWRGVCGGVVGRGGWPSSAQTNKFLPFDNSATIINTAVPLLFPVLFRNNICQALFCIVIVSLCVLLKLQPLMKVFKWIDNLKPGFKFKLIFHTWKCKHLKITTRFKKDLAILTKQLWYEM